MAMNRLVRKARMNDVENGDFHFTALYRPLEVHKCFFRIIKLSRVNEIFRLTIIKKFASPHLLVLLRKLGAI